MIQIEGGVQRAFTFPADLAAACAYFSDLRSVLTRLPHIRLVKAYAADQFRVLYHTVELGVYDVSLYCDLQARFDTATATLQVTPLENFPGMPARTTLRSLTGQGRYRSVSTFRAAGAMTQVEYRLALTAALPKPFGLNLISDHVVAGIAHSIVTGRIQEIADGFIQRSIEDFQGRAPR